MMEDELSLAVDVNPGQCAIKKEHEPEKLAAAGKFQNILGNEDLGVRKKEAGK